MGARPVMPRHLRAAAALASRRVRGLNHAALGSEGEPSDASTLWGEMTLELDQELGSIVAFSQKGPRVSVGQDCDVGEPQDLLDTRPGVTAVQDDGGAGTTRTSCPIDLDIGQASIH